jgi:hypothetical protein
MGGQAEVYFRVGLSPLSQSDRSQTSEVLDPLKYAWGLTWSPLLDFDNCNQEQEQKSSTIMYNKAVGKESAQNS